MAIPHSESTSEAVLMAEAERAAEAELANLQQPCMSGNWEQSVPTSIHLGQQTEVGQEWSFLQRHLMVRHRFLASRSGKEVAQILGHFIT